MDHHSQFSRMHLCSNILMLPPLWAPYTSILPLMDFQFTWFGQHFLFRDIWTSEEENFRPENALARAVLCMVRWQAASRALAHQMPEATSWAVTTQAISWQRQTVTQLSNTKFLNLQLWLGSLDSEMLWKPVSQQLQCSKWDYGMQLPLLNMDVMAIFSCQVDYTWN